MNIGIFASGRGSNFAAILQAIQQGHLPAGVTVLVSNKGDAGASAIARAHALHAIHLSQHQFPSEDAYVTRLLEVLREREVELIALAGYLKRIPARVIEEYRNRILNVHPALLPAFGGKGMYGMRVHQAVLASGVKVSGATVHFVDEEYDHGPILLQRTVDVSMDDTATSLAAKVLQVEHQIYAEALHAFADGRIHFKERTAWISSPK